MAKQGKQITANCSQNHLQKRYRKPYSPSSVQDIHAEHVTEDELVEMVKFAKMELLFRLKKYNLQSTKNNILAIRRFFDLERQEEQYQRAIKYSCEHLELIIKLMNDPKTHPEKKKFVLEEAERFLKLLKAFNK